MNTPSLADLLRSAGDLRARDIHVALPGKITEYSADEQKASVQPLLKRRAAGGGFLSMPVINSVPVIFPRGGGALLSFPLQRDDGVLLLFSERSIDEWLSGGGETEPGDPRMHHLADAIAVPGLLPFADAEGADARDVLLSFGDSEVRLASNGDARVQTRSGFLRVGNDGKVALGGSQELLAIVGELIEALASLTVVVAGNPGALDPPVATQLRLIRAKLQTIQE